MNVSENVEIIAILSPLEKVLYQKTEAIGQDEFSSVREIEKKLYNALKPYFPAAGLAAPQIGISKSVFIFSYDRDPSHLETIVNPTFTPVGTDTTEGWEGCLSVMNCCYKMAKVTRFTTIKAVYLTAQGLRVEKTLEGFAAKVFQHEYDHLQGMLIINRPDAQVQEFESKETMDTFLSEVKKADAARYKNPDLMQQQKN